MSIPDSPQGESGESGEGQPVEGGSLGQADIQEAFSSFELSREYELMQGMMTKIISIGVRFRCIDLMRSFHPTAYRIFQAASDEAARSFQIDPDEVDRFLAMTLTPTIKSFAQEHIDSNRSEKQLFDLFVADTREWAIIQARSAVAVTTRAELYHYGHQSIGTISARLREIEEVKGQLERANRLTPEARRTLDGRIDALSEQATQLIGYDEDRAIVLSALLRALENQPTNPTPFLALTAAGNEGGRHRLVKTPVQILSIDELADWFGLDNRTVSARVSQARGKAQKGEPDINPGAPIRSAAQLWSEMQP